MDSKGIIKRGAELVGCGAEPGWVVLPGTVESELEAVEGVCSYDFLREAIPCVDGSIPQGIAVILCV